MGAVERYLCWTGRVVTSLTRRRPVTCRGKLYNTKVTGDLTCDLGVAESEFGKSIGLSDLIIEGAIDGLTDLCRKDFSTSCNWFAGNLYPVAVLQMDPNGFIDDVR